MPAKIDVAALTARPASRAPQYTVAQSAKRAPLGDGTHAARGVHAKSGDAALVHVDGTRVVGITLSVVTCAIMHGVISRDEITALLAAADAAK